MEGRAAGGVVRDEAGVGAARGWEVAAEAVAWAEVAGKEAGAVGKDWAVGEGAQGAMDLEEAMGGWVGARAWVEMAVEMGREGAVDLAVGAALEAAWGWAVAKAAVGRGALVAAVDRSKRIRMAGWVGDAVKVVVAILGVVRRSTGTGMAGWVAGWPQAAHALHLQHRSQWALPAGQGAGMEKAFPRGSTMLDHTQFPSARANATHKLTWFTSLRSLRRRRSAAAAAAADLGLSSSAAATALTATTRATVKKKAA